MSRALPAVLILLSLAPAVLAQTDRADRLFEEGRRLMQRGEFAAACQRLGESHRLDPAPGTLVNLADCYEQLGRLADALIALREALALLKSWDGRVPLIKKQISELERRVPRLTIALAKDAPEDTRVERNGVTLGTASLGVAEQVNPGVVVIEAAASGHQPRRFELTLRAGESRAIEVAPGAAEVGDARSDQPANESPAAEARSRAGTARALGFVSLAIGVPCLVGWGIAELQLASNCGDRQCGQEELDRRVTVDRILFGLGVAGVGLGAYLILGPGSEPETAVVGAMLVPNGAGIAVARGF
jgi:tetratricopeptide (TPR) repeat protein